MTVSALLREVVGRTLVTRLRELRRDAALARLTGQDLPTADWGDIERALDAMWEEHEPV